MDSQDGVFRPLKITVLNLLVDGNTELQLTFPSDQGFDCFRNGDVVQGSDVSISNIDADNNQITVNGGDWTGTDGTNSGSAPQDDKLVSTFPRLTVASLATPNFVDNESIRMVNVNGDTSSYVPVTNTITNVASRADIEYTFTYVIEEAGSFVDTAAYQKLFDGNPNTEAETDLNKPGTGPDNYRQKIRKN